MAVARKGIGRHRAVSEAASFFIFHVARESDGELAEIESEVLGLAAGLQLRQQRIELVSLPKVLIVQRAHSLGPPRVQSGEYPRELLVFEREVRLETRAKLTRCSREPRGVHVSPGRERRSRICYYLHQQAAQLDVLSEHLVSNHRWENQ